MPKMKYDRDAVLAYIIAYKECNDGNSPTIREIMGGCHVSSSSMVFYILRDLQDARKIHIQEGSRGIVIPGGKWRIE